MRTFLDRKKLKSTIFIFLSTSFLILFLTSCVAYVSPGPRQQLAWVPGHWENGYWIKGHYAPYYVGPAYYPGGAVWVPGHWNRYGAWVPGHWRY